MHKNNYRRNIGSVSCGTMRPEDLISSFLRELKQMRPLRREHAKLIQQIENLIESVGDYENSEEIDNALSELFDALDAYALPYFYFGAHPGDGADYGYWLSESFEDDFDGLKVSDTSEIPAGYRGEVLHINDHGNMTLYVKSARKLTEIWGIV